MKFLPGMLISGITIVVSWMNNMVCFRNVDLTGCNNDVTGLPSRLLACVDLTPYRNLNHKKGFFNSEVTKMS